MYEKILALLVSAFSGVRKDGLTQLARALSLQVSTEEDAKALVEKLTKEQVDGFIKDYRADVDREVSEGNNTFEANLRRKYNLVEKKDEPKGPSDNDKGKGGSERDIDAIVAQAVAAAVKPLEEKLGKYEGESIANSRLRALTEKLESCKDEAFKAKALKDYKRMKFGTEEEFNEYLNDTASDIESVNQNVANGSLGRLGAPVNPKRDPKNEASEDELKAVTSRLQII